MAQKKKKPQEPEVPNPNWWQDIDWQNTKPNEVSKILLRLTAPQLAQLYGTEETPDLYDIPELKFNAPDINDYIAGGDKFNSAYNMLAPTFWDTYQKSVENPLIGRFGGSGMLGSAMGGLSGAAANTLLSSRGQAENQIQSQAFQAAQTPLLAAFQQAGEEAKIQGLEPWKAQLEELQYPYQILPGLVSGTLPPKVVEQESGGK